MTNYPWTCNVWKTALVSSTSILIAIKTKKNGVPLARLLKSMTSVLFRMTKMISRFGSQKRRLRVVITREQKKE